MIPLISDSGIGITFWTKEPEQEPLPGRSRHHSWSRYPLLELAPLLESAPLLELAPLSHESHIFSEVKLYTLETYTYFQK